MAPRFIAKQLSRPSGFMGAVIRHLMNRDNARMNAFAVKQLQFGPSDRVLEIGFGGGVTLPALLDAATFVAGVDRSSDVVDWAQRHFASSVKAGRAEFCQGNVRIAAIRSSRVLKGLHGQHGLFLVLAPGRLGEIRRVLRPQGRVAVGFLPKERMDRMGMPEDIFTTRAPLDVVGALTKTGFMDVLIARPQPHTPWNVIVATR
jgi:SAM-dependent methyltransferase